jgi:hypothetical protein
MKKIFVVVFASLLVSTAFGADSIMTLEFLDSGSSNKVVVVQKESHLRRFLLCDKGDGTQASCVKLHEFSVQKFRYKKTKVSTGKIWKTWKFDLSIPAAILGIFPSGLIARMESLKFSESPVNANAFILAEITITGMAFLLGSWMDGHHFTALQAASISGTIGLPDVLNENFRGALSLPLTIDDFKNLSSIAASALNKKAEE